MKITRDVIIDLLPLYLADEVSEDTRTLVEQFLANDPALAKLVEQSNIQQWDDVPVPLNKENEMKSFEKTKQLLVQQRVLMGFAIFSTLMIVAVRGGEAGIRWLWHDLPQVGWLLMFVSVVFWAAYFNITAALKK
ncbi:MAG: hypothetical protein IPJ90_18850 [Anaerolineaceae bacterium]|nr:hypothetical protein [Anaerolineaceae bacterium]